MDDEAADALAKLQRDRRPAAPAPAPAPIPQPSAVQRPVRLTTGMALLALLSLLLIAVGIWALGAILYMSMVTPAVSQDDVRYPLIHWDWLHYRYSASSRLLAGAMLLCWPVAAILLGAVAIMRRAARRRITPAYRR
jgi:hypothetical protein